MNIELLAAEMRKVLDAKFAPVLERLDKLEEQARNIESRDGELLNLISRAESRLGARIDALERRLVEVESWSIADAYAGSWSAGEFERGQLVTHKGALWLALADTSEEPGDGSTSWRLVSKSGRKAPASLIRRLDKLESRLKALESADGSDAEVVELRRA